MGACFEREAVEASPQEKKQTAPMASKQEPTSWTPTEAGSESTTDGRPTVEALSLARAGRPANEDAYVLEEEFTSSLMFAAALGGRRTRMHTCWRRSSLR